MKANTRRALRIAVLSALALGACGCGQEELIDVTRLPAGNARGSVASGLYNWNETVTSSSCRETVTVGTATVHLPSTDDRWGAAADVIQDEGYFGVYMSAFGGSSAPADVARPDFLADGGLYVEGQSRIGGVFALGTGVQARVLLDGQFLPPPSECGGVVRSFQGTAIVQVQATGGEGAAAYSCSYSLSFTADRGYCP